MGRVHPGKQPRVYPPDHQAAIGSTQVRKVRGPLLDTLYARLMRCGNLACTGKPFIEHRNIPDLRPDPADPGSHGNRPARAALPWACTCGS